MYKIYAKNGGMPIGSVREIWFIMRLTTIILLVTFLQVNATGFAQKISMSKKNAPLKTVLKDLRGQSGYNFVYTDNLLRMAKPVDIAVSSADFEEVLEVIFRSQPLTYTMNRNTITLREKDRLSVPATEDRADIVVRGRVTDSKGETLPGVSIKVKGTTAGTSTDIEGRFSISVPENATLVVTYIGYTTQEVAVSGQATLNVVLQASTSALSEVVVTALGISREAKSLTYSTQSVKTEELTEARELNVINSLQGKVAGLSINSSGAGVGAPSRVVLRGNRSISSDNQVLYVIDGVPIRGFPDNLNSDNIASINVLKGPNSAALYGSQGQNGAIVIETKRGAAGKVDISLNNTYMAQTADRSIPYQNIFGQGSGGNYIKSSESSWGPRMEGQLVDHWSPDPALAATKIPYSSQPNNRYDIFQTGHNLATNLIANIGGEKTQTVFSYTLTDGTGILPNNQLQRHNISLRMTNKLTSRLTLDSKLDYMRQNIDNPLAEGESSFNPFRQIYTMPGNIRTEDVSKFEYTDASGFVRQNYWYPGTTTGASPYWTIYRNVRDNNGSRMIAMSSLAYKFSDAFNVMARGSYDGDNFNSSEKSYFGTYRDPAGRFQVGANEGRQLNVDFLASYDKDVAKDFNVNVNFGGNIRSHRSSSVSSSTGTAMLVPNFFALSNTTLPVTTYNPGSNYETHSLYSSATFGWKSALYLDVTGRNDWSSTLPAANRSYFYPSVGLGAVISDLVNLPKAFSFAKLRATWAQVGNSPSPYQLERTATFSAGGNQGYLQLSSTLPAKDLHAETTVSTELGLDLRLFNDRLGFDLTAYKTNTKDQLFTIALPVGSGASLAFINGGNVQNKGFEAVVSGTPVKTDKFSWDMNLNFALNRNMVLSISDERPRLVVGSDSYFREFVIEQGAPYGRMYSRGWARDAQGRVIVGADGMPQITAGRTVLVGDINPDWTGGVSSSLNYGNFSASFTIGHKQGGSMASFTDAILSGEGLLQQTVAGRTGSPGLIFGQSVFANEVAVRADGTPNTIAVDAQKFWQGVGGRNAPVGEAFVNDATNTRLRELVLGYSLPKSVFGKLPVSNVKLSLVGRNLFFLYRAAKTLDPDYTEGINNVSEGFQSFAPPTTRSYGLNLKIDF